MTKIYPADILPLLAGVGTGTLYRYAIPQGGKIIPLIIGTVIADFGTALLNGVRAQYGAKAAIDFMDRGFQVLSERPINQQLILLEKFKDELNKGIDGANKYSYTLSAHFIKWSLDLDLATLTINSINGLIDLSIDPLIDFLNIANNYIKLSNINKLCKKGIQAFEDVLSNNIDNSEFVSEYYLMPEVMDFNSICVPLVSILEELGLKTQNQLATLFEKYPSKDWMKFLPDLNAKLNAEITKIKLEDYPKQDVYQSDELFTENYVNPGIIHASEIMEMGRVENYDLLSVNESIHN